MLIMNIFGLPSKNSHHRIISFQVPRKKEKKSNYYSHVQREHFKLCVHGFHISTRFTIIWAETYVSKGIFEDEW